MCVYVHMQKTYMCAYSYVYEENAYNYRCIFIEQ